jgi:hypothetical protein
VGYIPQQQLPKKMDGIATTHLSLSIKTKQTLLGNSFLNVFIVYQTLLSHWV